LRYPKIRKKKTRPDLLLPLAIAPKPELRYGKLEHKAFSWGKGANWNNET